MTPVEEAVQGLTTAVNALTGQFTELREELDEMQQTEGDQKTSKKKPLSARRRYWDPSFRLLVPFKLDNLLTAIDGGGQELDNWCAESTIYFIDRLLSDKMEAHALKMPTSQTLILFGFEFACRTGHVEVAVYNRCGGNADFPNDPFDTAVDAIMGNETSKTELHPKLSELGRESRRIMLKRILPILVDKVCTHVNVEEERTATFEELTDAYTDLWRPASNSGGVEEEEAADAAAPAKTKKTWTDDELIPFGCSALFDIVQDSSSLEYTYLAMDFVNLCEKITDEFDIGDGEGGATLAMQAYVIFLFRKLSIVRKDGRLNTFFDIADQKKEFEDLMPRILNLMACPKRVPSGDMAVLQHQEDNRYVPYVPTAAVAGKKKKVKIVTRVPSRSDGFARPRPAGHT